MSETSTPPEAEVQNPAPATTPPAAEAPKLDRASLTPEQRQMVLAGKVGDVIAQQQEAKAKADEPPAGEKPPVEKPKDEPAKPDQAATKVEETTPAEKKTDDNEDGPVELPKLRVKPKDGLELEFLNLLQQGKSVKEASEAVYGSAQPTKEKTPKQEAAPKEESPFKDVDQTLNQANTELEDLEKRLEEAEEAEDIKEVSKLNREVMEKRGEIKDLNNQRKQIEEGIESDQIAEHNAKVAESSDRIFEKYPELGEEDSAIRAEFVKFYQGKTADPEYSDIFKSPRWPEMLAREFAEAKGLTPAGSKPPAPSTPPDETPKETTPKSEEKPAPKSDQREVKQPPKASASKTLTTGDDHARGTTQVSRETYQQDRKNMTLEEKKKLLGFAKPAVR